MQDSADLQYEHYKYVSALKMPSQSKAPKEPKASVTNYDTRS